MMPPPEFSVIIPAFNAQSTVGAAIGSVLRQTCSNLEAIVVDDGSVDDTAARVRAIADPRVRLVSQSNRGLPAARNAGVAASRGQLLAFLDSDDLLLASFLEHARDALRSTPGAGFAYTDAYVLDDASGRIRVRTAMARNRPPVPPPSSAETFLAELLRSNFVYVSTVVPRTVFDEVGGFDERRTSSEDYELWLKICLAGYRAAWMPACEAIYRRHDAQMSNNLPRMYHSLQAVFADLELQRIDSAQLRGVIVERRRQLRRQARVAAATRVIPAAAIAAVKRMRAPEPWYDTAPLPVREALDIASG